MCRCSWLLTILGLADPTSLRVAALGLSGGSLTHDCGVVSIMCSVPDVADERRPEGGWLGARDARHGAAAAPRTPRLLGIPGLVSDVCSLAVGFCSVRDESHAKNATAQRDFWGGCDEQDADGCPHKLRCSHGPRCRRLLFSRFFSQRRRAVLQACMRSSPRR